MQSFPRGIVTTGIVLMSATAFMVLATLPVLAAPTPADKCEASKNKTAGAYYSCREKAESTAITKALPADYSKCTAKFDDKWDGAEATGAGACPDTVLTAPMNAYLAAQAAEAALVISGAIASIPDCVGDLATCDGDLAACEAAPAAQTLQTGQTLCHNSAGTLISCAGTGQDGELQKGVPRSFTDNGDGTITDNGTGLMWEKLSDDGTIHDKDTTYTWANAYATKIDGLNGVSFGGHADWRLPNRVELETLRDLGASGPATHAAFDTGCVATCTVGSCSCTDVGPYWSSTTVANNTDFAWNIDMTDGGGSDAGSSKAGALRVRAVRGTSNGETCTLGELTACETDLAACTSDCVASVRPPLRTGQTTCYDSAGIVIACAGTGQDGELLKGAALSFTDNGDGTITDNTTGLMWEKLSDDGSIHDWDTTYNWTTAVTTKMAALNSAVFAGHNDWRLPNRNELLTLANIGAVNPATFSVFDAACAPGCTELTCSCTQSRYYWSSSTYQGGPTFAWSVGFGAGDTGASGKTGSRYVRGVRAGS